MSERDWRFEEARAMVNKGSQGVLLVCYRYLYITSNTNGMVALDVLWSSVISYWTRVVKRLGMKRDLVKRSVISHLRVHFKKDTLLDRQRVGNMFVFQTIKKLLLDHPADIMKTPRKCVMLIHNYTYCDFKHSLPRPPHVSKSLSDARIYSVIS